MNCRNCTKPLEHTFLDLGYAPPSNAYLSFKDLNGPEVYYPLKIKVCDNCWLVQTEDYAEADALFTYAPSDTNDNVIIFTAANPDMINMWDFGNGLKGEGSIVSAVYPMPAFTQ